MKMKTQRIWEVGDEVIAVAGQFSVCITNDVGGTENLPKGRYRVRLTKQWNDYETGQVLHGELIEKDDIAKARKAGTTPWTPEHYRKEYPANPGLALRAAKAKKEFNPKKVFFSGFNCELVSEERKVSRGR